MKSILASVIALGLAASTSFAQLTITTPSNVIICEPLLISWSGGQPPYIVQIQEERTRTVLATTDQIYGTTATWVVDLDASFVNNKQILYFITDGAGLTQYSGAFPILAGTNVNCEGQPIAFSVSATGPAASTPGGSESLPSSTPTSVATSTITSSTITGSPASGAANTGSRSGSSTISSTSSRPSPSDAASRVTGKFAVAGIIGAAMVALLG